MFSDAAGKGDTGRRSTRGRKVSQRMAIVDDATRKQAAMARLDALENDNEPENVLAADSEDDEYVIDNSDEDEEELGLGMAAVAQKAKKKKRPAFKSKTRSKFDRRGPQSFARLLEESGLDASSPGPNYLTAAAGPSTRAAARKFCAVCGNTSSYTCARCGSRYCCRKCYAVHTETRCLKFMA